MKEVQHTAISHKPKGSLLGNITRYSIYIIIAINVLIAYMIFASSISKTSPIFGSLMSLLPFILGGYFVYRKFFKNRSVKPLASSAKGIQLNRTVTIENPYSGIFISGGAGSGKSKSIVEPIIYDAGLKNYTGVVYDFKFPELAKHVATAYANSHVQPYYINFTDMNFTDRINPIAPELMKNDSFAREFAYSILANLNPSMISKPDFWSDNSIALLSSVFWFLKAEHPEKCTLPHAISLILNPDLELLLTMLQTNDKSADMIATIITAHRTGAQNQLSGVISSLQVALSKINTSEIYFVTSSSDFSLNVNEPSTPSILTIGNDPTLAESYAPIIGLILTSLSKQINQSGKEPSLFLIDEFPTVFIPKVEQLPATGRSNKITTVLACQDIAQMVDRYGKDKADTILSNLGNQFYGRTTNPETAKRVSTLFGKSDKLMQTVNDSKSKKDFEFKSNNTQGSSYSYQERDLVKVQDVAMLETGSFYTILSEGKIKQGKVSIPLNLKAYQSEIPQKRAFTDDEIENNFSRIKKESRELLQSYSTP
jgi:type IV secretory pathway TraG/TraD family ATPase VirD4